MTRATLKLVIGATIFMLLFGIQENASAQIPVVGPSLEQFVIEARGGLVNYLTDKLKRMSINDPERLGTEKELEVAMKLQASRRNSYLSK